MKCELVGPRLCLRYSDNRKALTRGVNEAFTQPSAGIVAKRYGNKSVLTQVS